MGRQNRRDSCVVERAVRDYLTVHPHVNALEVDVRSVGPSPRSREVDEALIRIVGAADMDAVAGLGGGGIVWDSLDRRGDPPTARRVVRRPAIKRRGANV